MVEVHKKLSRHSTLIASGLGLLVSLLMLALASAALIQQLVQDARQQQDRSVALIADISVQSKALLARLNADFKPDCSPQNLAALNSLLFEYRFHKDIGLYNSDGLMYCTSGMGRLLRPQADPPTPYITKVGGPIWFDVPAPLGMGKVRTTMMRSGVYNMSIDPGVIADVMNNADIIWFGNVTTPSHVSSRVSNDLLLAIQDIDQKKQTGWRILWSQRVIVSVARVNGTLVHFANFRNLREAYTEQLLLTGVLFLFSLLLGIVTAVVMKPRLARMASLRNRLSKLLDERHVLCMYQPIIDLSTGRPVGCEVLMRLQDQGELIYPADIIPAAQLQKLTWQLDRAVLLASMQELPVLLPHIKGFKLAFNLFPESIRFAPVHALVEAALPDCAKYSVRLGIEVTEYDFSETMIPELRQFERTGYQISVDDFGTGYSNLNTVKKVAPHALKIDKSFVYEMEDASVRSSMIPEIANIAKAVGADVVAEGIENQAQAEKLLSLGIPFGQGYFFARPMPLGAFIEYLRGFSHA